MSERMSEGHATTKTASSQPLGRARVSPPASEVCELIARRAYELYKDRGSEFCDELSDWLKAESEVVTMLLAEPQETSETKKRNGRLPARPRDGASIGKAANGARRQVTSHPKLKDNPA